MNAIPFQGKQKPSEREINGDARNPFSTPDGRKTSVCVIPPNKSSHSNIHPCPPQETQKTKDGPWRKEHEKFCMRSLQSREFPATPPPPASHITNSFIEFRLTYSRSIMICKQKGSVVIFNFRTKDLLQVTNNMYFDSRLIQTNRQK